MDNGIGAVLSGDKALKFEVDFSALSIVYIATAVLFAVAIGVYVGKKL